MSKLFRLNKISNKTSKESPDMYNICSLASVRVNKYQSVPYLNDQVIVSEKSPCRRLHSYLRHVDFLRKTRYSLPTSGRLTQTVAEYESTYTYSVLT